MYNFDFNKDKDFFKQSPTFNLLKEEITKASQPNGRLEGMDVKLLNASLMLWAESVIKHNLDINMTRVDHINLLSEQNSKKVLDIFGKIIFKSKDKRTTKEFQILREQSIVANYINLLSFYKNDENIDLFSNLKNEFSDFKSLTLSSVKKNRP